jgi:hypothetical protein
VAIEEYVVILNSQDEPSAKPQLTWVGAAAGAEIAEPGKNRPVKTATVIRVQAESASEAITGAKQCFPNAVNGTIYGILKSSLTTG